MEKRLSVPNLLSFIVANLDAETRVKLALSICGDDCLQEVRVELAKKLELIPEAGAMASNILSGSLKNHAYNDEL